MVIEMRKPTCIIRIEAEVTTGKEKKIIPAVSMFPLLDIKEVNKILDDVLGINLDDLFKIIEKGNKKILGDYLVYKGKTKYYWRKVNSSGIPEDLAFNYIQI